MTFGFRTLGSSTLRQRAWLAAGFLIVGGVLVGCADDGETATNICDDMQTEYDTYSSGLTKLGDNGVLKVRLMDANPAPPDRGMNDWTIQLLDMSDAPMPNATISAVTPFMPAHGHGSGTQPVIGTTDSNGEVGVDGIDFMMPGVWTVTVDTDMGGTADTATFAFCIDG